MDWATESDDLAILSQDQSPDSIIQTLQQRHAVGRACAWVGSDTLICLGSTVASSDAYDRAAESNVTLYEESILEPHVLQVASLAFYEMLYHHQDQTIIFTGETGSGKSLSRKLASQQLIKIARNGKKKSRVLSGASKMESVLELFGHYETEASKNASGFGRYTEYQYNEAGRMVGVKLLDYALDIRRVTCFRPFFIFKAFLAGANADERELLQLNEAFFYVSDVVRSNTGRLVRTNSRRKQQVDLKEKNTFDELRENLKSLGVGRRTQAQVFKVLAAILHLGNLEFAESDQDNLNCKVQNTDTLNLCAELLDLTPLSLQNALVYKSKWISRELCSVALKPNEASLQRDELAQMLYSLVFSWLVEHLNERLCKSDEEVKQTIGITDFPWYRTEMGANLPVDFNSLVSNYCQERIVHVMHMNWFDNVGNMLRTDNIPITIPHYQDNLWCVDLFRGTSKQDGLFSVIDRAVQGKRPSSFAQDLLEGMDHLLKQNPHYIPSTKCSTGFSSFLGRPKPIFGIRHHHQGPSIEYDLEQFVEQGTTLTDFVALFKISQSGGENGPFIPYLLSKKTGLNVKKHETSKVYQPSRKPSIKRKKGPESAKTTVNEFESASQSMDDVIEAIENSRSWVVMCVKPSEVDKQFDTRYVKRQFNLLSIFELAQFRAKMDVDYGLPIGDFTEKYSALIKSKGASSLDEFVSLMNWSREYAMGSTKIYLSRRIWRWLYANSTTSLNPPADIMNYENEEDGASDNESSNGSLEKIMPRGASKFYDIERGPGAEAKKKKEGPKEFVESVTTISGSRRSWVCCTWFLTWWIPVFGKSRPDIRMAWREKVAICIIIAFMNLALLFLIVGLRYVICPPSTIRTQDEVQGMAKGQTVPYVMAQGRYYYIEDLVSQHKKDFKTMNVESLFKNTYGTDVSKYFFKQDLWGAYCKLPPPQSSVWDYLDQGVDWMKRPTSSAIPLHRWTNTNNAPQPYLMALHKYSRGKIGWSLNLVKAKASQTSQYVVIYKNVYIVTPMMAATNGTFAPEIARLVAQNYGKDMTAEWEQGIRQYGRDIMAQHLECMNNFFYVGTVDSRESIQCTLSNTILMGASCILVAVIGIKFLTALQFSSRKNPEDSDKFVICMIPCYTEGTDSLTKALDSIATTNYDDKHKLIFVICDGMIIGSGNDKPTPRIVLDILGVDTSVEPEPLAFQSLGEGNKQYNRAKVYSGLYEIRGHSVPFIVVVKVGSESERVKPGNRGKRDSQMLLMRFLSRVHFNADFSPLELELYHHMKNVIGVSPSYYEFILMVDADTVVEENSVNSLVSMMTHDVKIMGLCGETTISNEKESWVTMIQVYEYFISHHLSKAFESLFGSVTCLPGCFCMYRIRTATKNVPLLIAPSVLADYGVNNVDTLHTKNLLHLGEDRYLTTLMLKHFPQLRTKFTNEAKCLTAVPDRWPVLLSQRRRWINSTVHNLFELIFLEQLCGLCCFSMRFVVLLDLFATFVQPATVLYIVYLVYAGIFGGEQFPMFSLILIGAIYGLQAIIFLIKKEWAHVAWMIIYIFAIPVFSFWLPMYSFWRFDDFSWGNTRVVVGEGKKTLYVAEVEPFDPNSIPLKKWRDLKEDNWDTASVATTSKKELPPNYAASEYSNISRRQTENDRKRISAISFGGLSNVGLGNYRPAAPPIPPSVSAAPSVTSTAGGPTENQLLEEIRQIISTADLMSITKKQIRDELSRRFGVDLKDRKDVINRLVDTVLQERF